MYFIETSAKSCDNVERLFSEIASELLQVCGGGAFIVIHSLTANSFLYDRSIYYLVG